MSTPIASTEPRDIILTQLLAVAAVTTAFPVTTLAGTTANRFLTQHNLIVATPANKQIVDEQGDVLAVYFLTASPLFYAFTQKGKARIELELSRSAGY